MASRSSTNKPKPKSTAQTALIANPQQAAAIAHMNGPAAFIAAAGTGKTSILVQRLVRLIADEKIAPEAVLCVTFTRAAANEMEKRALKALKGRGFSATDVKGLRVVTFHGLGHQMLREKLQWTPRELNQRLISGDPRQWIAEDITRAWRSNRSRGMNWSVDVAHVLAAVDRAKEALLLPEQSAEFFHDSLLLDNDIALRYQEFFKTYEATKKKEKWYDLSDLIYVPLLMLQSSPTFRKSWQGRYQYLQIDETQDTSPSQYQMVQYLAAPRNNVVIVGDPDQAIYQFRGASPEASILSFKTMYPTGTIYHIEHNYRSTPQILAAANQLISHNPVTPGFEKMLRPTVADGSPVIVTAYEDQVSEAEGIARRIIQLVADGKQEDDGISYRDIFVLSRTNHHLASSEIMFAQQRIPYRSLGSSSFFKRKTTRDMLAFLALVDGMRLQHEFVASRNGPNPLRWDDIFTPVMCGEQNAAFRLAAQVPSQGYFAATGRSSHRLPPAFFSGLTALVAGRPLLQFCDEQSYSIDIKYQPGMKDFVALIHMVAQRCHNHPAEAVKLIRELAYDNYLRQRGTQPKDDTEEDGDDATDDPQEDTRLESRYDELDEFTQIAQRHHTIRHFLEAMAQLKDQAEDTSKNKRDCVTMMTIHKSKGLEQKVVFVMGMVEGIFPHNRSFSLSNDDGPVVISGVAEERRLAYVAFTRAQQMLLLTSIVRYRGGEATPSRFIEEAGLTPTAEDGIINPFLIKRDGSPRRKNPTLMIPTLFDV